MNVTQSAVSAAIAALEERYGVRLFDRVGRGIRLSEAGHLFLPEARAVVAQAAAAENVLDEISGLKRGTLRAVASQTIAAYWIPSILVAFRRKYQQITVELAVSNTEEAAKKPRRRSGKGRLNWGSWRQLSMIQRSRSGRWGKTI